MNRSRLSAEDIMSRMAQVGLVDSIEAVREQADIPGRRQMRGTCDSQSGWTIDVTSWCDPLELDWIGHLQALSGPEAAALLIGQNWAVSVDQDGKFGDSNRIVQILSEILPNAVVLWSEMNRSARQSSRFENVDQVIQEFAANGVTVDRLPIDLSFGVDLLRLSEEDIFAFVQVGLGGSADAFARVTILIENEWADPQARNNSGRIAGEGWTVQVWDTDSAGLIPQTAIERMAQALNATNQISDWGSNRSPRIHRSRQLGNPIVANVPHAHLRFDTYLRCRP